MLVQEQCSRELTTIFVLCSFTVAFDIQLLHIFLVCESRSAPLFSQSLASHATPQVFGLFNMNTIECIWATKCE